jgi:hypothetical protein
VIFVKYRVFCGNIASKMVCLIVLICATGVSDAILIGVGRTATGVPNFSILHGIRPLSSLNRIRVY